MELQFFRERAAEMDPKLLIDHIQRMASGEAPFFSTTLSLVYDELVEKSFTEHTPSDPGPGGCTEGESPIHPIPPQSSTPTPNTPPLPAADTIASSSNLQAPASIHVPVPPTIIPSTTWLKCRQCGEPSWLRDLRKGLHCPRCPLGGGGGKKQKAKILMQCSSCNQARGTLRGDCERRACRRIFL